MPRYKLTVEYDGGAFVGWQRQGLGVSVQSELERALSAFASESVRVNGAGRTDAGVHATGQVAHIDLSRAWPTDTVRDATNAHLRPARIAVVAAEQVGDDFDARFSATARHYCYRILNRRAPPALERGQIWHVARALDAAAMAAAAERLLGRHDFTTFRSTQCQAKSPIRTLDRLAVTRLGDVIAIEASARSFLHNQVRSMVGSLAMVGDGRWSADDLENALIARDRTACGPVAPPDGLALVRVDY